MSRYRSVARHVLLAASLPILTVLATGGFVHADDTGLGISRVDASGYPWVTIEFSAPAGSTNGTLSAGNVALLEDAQTLPFQFEAVPTSGLEVVMLIDTSASMHEGDAIGAAKAAAQKFLQVLPREVAVGVVSFADTASLVTPLTLDRILLGASIAGLTAHGETSMYDAFAFGQTLFSGGTPDRQFVLLSDGGDTASKATLADAVTIATDTRTNVIELVSSEANRAALAQLSGADNGTLNAATDPAGLDRAYLQVANALVNRYRLTFQTAAVGDVRYVVRVATIGDPVELATAVSLPTPPVTALPSTTSVASTTPTTGGLSAQPVPTTSAATAGPSNPGSTRGASGALFALGVAAFFIAISLLVLLAFPATRARMTRPELGPRRDSAEPLEGIWSRINDAVDRFLERHGRRRALTEALDTASIPLRPGQFLVVTLAAGLTAGLVLYTVAGPIGFLGGVAVTPLLARFAVKARAGKRRKAFAEQLPDVLLMLVTSLRGGFGLPQALDAVANQSPEPARTEFQRVLFEIRIGRDPGAALAATAKRMKSRDFDWVVSAMQINREIGGELAQILETVAETVRDRQKMKRQIQTLTAEGRISAYILTGLPPFLVVVMSLLNPGYFAPMTKSPGPFLIVLGVVMMILGWAWMTKLVKSHL